MKIRERKDDMLSLMKRLTILMVFILILIAVGLYLLYKYINNDGYSYVGVLVFTTGLLGGFVSIQQRLHKIQDDELQLLSASWLATALVPINGGIFALVLMLMFMAGLLEGSLFPKFPDLTVSNINSFKDWLSFSYPQTGSGMAKLFFWSFVAGFSERFVPRIIGNVTNESITITNKTNHQQKNISNDKIFVKK